MLCSGCLCDSSQVSHTCDVCGNKNHPSCGKPVEEKQGGHVRCNHCVLPPTPSAAPAQPPTSRPQQPPAEPPTKRPRRPKQPRLDAFFSMQNVEESTSRQCDDDLLASISSRSGGAVADVVINEKWRSAHDRDMSATDSSATTIESTAQRGQEQLQPPIRRTPQVVSTLSDRARVVKYMTMLHEAGVKQLPFKAVAEFPAIFRSNSKANLQKASRWWKDREKHLQNKRRSVVAVQGGVKKCMKIKAWPGRGKKREAWVEWMYSQLLGEFCRLRKASVKISRTLLLEIARHILANSDGEFTAKSRSKKGKTLQELLTYKWIQQFCHCFDIVTRRQCGRLQCSEEKEEEIERSVAAHLGQVKRAFESGDLDENEVFNMDEAHFVINMDDKKTLGFKGDEKVSYHDVVSGGEGMTLVIKIRGGPSARIEPPMIIFQNKNRSYPIRGLKDDVAGVTYRSGPKGWMDHKVFYSWLDSNICNRRQVHGKQQNIYMDNASGHKLDECGAVVTRKNIDVRFLPANSTHLCQPADSFIIKSIKQIWMQEWEKEKWRLAESGGFSKRNEDGKWSGKLQNPGKRFFFGLAARCVRQVNLMEDDKHVSHPRKL